MRKVASSPPWSVDNCTVISERVGTTVEVDESGKSLIVSSSQEADTGDAAETDACIYSDRSDKPSRGGTTGGEYNCPIGEIYSP